MNIRHGGHQWALKYKPTTDLLARAVRVWTSDPLGATKVAPSKSTNASDIEITKDMHVAGANRDEPAEKDTMRDTKGLR